MYVVTADEMLKRGLELMGAGDKQSRMTKTARSTQLRRFRSHFGSNPCVYSDLWEALQVTDIPEAKITVTKLRDLDKFLMTIFYLKNYDTYEVVASRFGRDEGFVRDYCWYYIERIAALLPAVIYWPEEWNDGDGEDLPTFLISVDGTHCQIQEPMHPMWSKNPQYYSHKFQKAALNYEVAISIYENRVVWINGPFPGATHDITGEYSKACHLHFQEAHLISFHHIFAVFAQGLSNMIPKGKLAVADRGYNSKELAQFTSTPNLFDDPEVKKFKSRCRSRQETFNARLKNFAVLDNRFRHGEVKHKIAFEAVCIICQLQLDNGSPLFEA